MCIEYDGKLKRAPRRIIGWKVVRTTARRGTFTSICHPSLRNLQPGFLTTGERLTYRGGRVIVAPVNSPGIYVYLDPRIAVSRGRRVIEVAIRKGTMVRYGHGNKLTAAKVKVVRVLPL